MLTIKAQPNPKHTAVPTSIALCPDPATDKEYRVTYPWDTEPCEMPNLLIDDVLYLPVTGTLVTPELAGKRRGLRMTGQFPWSDQACEPNYTIRYIPLHSRLISTVGRMI